MTVDFGGQIFEILLSPAMGIAAQRRKKDRNKKLPTPKAAAS